MFSTYIQVFAQLISVSQAQWPVVEGNLKMPIEYDIESTVSPESMVDEVISTETFTNTVCVYVVEEACVEASICRLLTAASEADLEACIQKKGQNCSNISKDFVVSKSIDYVPIGEACKNTEGACLPRRQCVPDAVPTTTSASVSPNWVFKSTDTGCILREEMAMEADGPLVWVQERVKFDPEANNVDEELERCSIELAALAEVSSEELSALGMGSPGEEDEDIQMPSFAKGWGRVLISLFC